MARGKLAVGQAPISPRDLFHAQTPREEGWFWGKGPEVEVPPDCKAFARIYRGEIPGVCLLATRICRACSFNLKWCYINMLA
eukprot:3173929-Rhodomonas_salina.2